MIKKMLLMLLLLMFPLASVASVLAKATPTPVKKVVQKKIPYTLYKSDRPLIVLVVIDPKYTDKNDMHLLGQQLKTAYKSKPAIRISIFTSSKAARLWEKILADTMTDSESKYYDLHYVGQYNKNSTTKLNMYAIYYGGVNGKQETIKF